MLRVVKISSCLVAPWVTYVQLFIREGTVVGGMGMGKFDASYKNHLDLFDVKPEVHGGKFYLHEPLCLTDFTCKT